MLVTEDIYLAAFGLVSGGDLAEVTVHGTNGRRMAFFRIDGAGMEQVERDYYRGSASVNLQLLKAQVRRLKDMAFDAMRQERPQAEHLYRASAIHSREVGRTTMRSAEDADVGAEGAAQREEERNHASESRGNRRDQKAERPLRSRHRAWD
jgi:hypothetical protein